MNPGPRYLCRLCKKYCKASEKFVKCEECEKRFHTSCTSLDEKELQELESGMDLGIAATAKLTVVYVVVLFYMVTKQSNVTNVKCGFTINAHSSQNLNLIL